MQIAQGNLIGRRKQPRAGALPAARIQGQLDGLQSVIEHIPEAVGVLVEHGWGKPNEFVPWSRVLRIEDDAIFIAPAEGNGRYPPFVDQAGWILINEHFMGRTVFDMDGRRVEVPA